MSRELARLLPDHVLQTLLQDSERRGSLGTPFHAPFLRTVQSKDIEPATAFLTMGMNSNTNSLPLVLKREKTVMAVIDISGYTTISRRLIEAGISAPTAYSASEWVGRTVKHCLDPVVQMVIASGGDVVKYGGDAITALWYTNEDGEEILSETKKNELIRKKLLNAAQCCIDAAHRIRTEPFLGPDGTAVELGAHSVVDCGDIYIIHVGTNHELDESGRIETVCTGRIFTRMCRYLNKTSKDTVLVTAPQWVSGMASHLVNLSSKRKTSAGYYEFSIRSKLGATRAPHRFDSPETLLRTKLLDQLRMLPDDAPLIQRIPCFVDTSILTRLRENFNLAEMRELRQMTVAFLNIVYAPEDAGNPSKDEYKFLCQFADQLQQLMHVVIQALNGKSRHAPLGLLRQIAVDDKGLTILCLFGLPPAIHEDTSAPAALAMLQIVKQLHAMNAPFKVSIGIATDSVFSGMISSFDAMRLEHAVLGGAVNLAARFMMHREAQNRILCDETTATQLKKTSTSARLMRLPHRLQLKGWDQPVPAWMIDTSNQGNLATSIARSATILKSELHTVRDIPFRSEDDDEIWKSRIQQWHKDQKPCTIVIEGASGMGKSVILQRVIGYCQTDIECLVWQLRSYEIDSSVPLHSWRLLERLLLDSFKEDPELEKLINESDDQKRFQAICDLFKLEHDQTLSILNDLKSLLDPTEAALKVADATADLQQLQERVNSLIENVLNALCEFKKLCICMEDCHWQDSFSWRITYNIVTQCPKVLVIMASRPPREYVDAAVRSGIYEAVSRQRPETTLHLVVDKVTLVQLRRVLETLAKGCEQGAIERLAETMLQQTNGNAFAMNLMLQHLQRSGKLSALANGTTLLVDPSDFLPRDVNAVFVSQLDRLDPMFQRLVRTAALLGQVFHLLEVAELARVEILPALLADQFCEWDRFAFFEPLSEAWRWRFRHCLIQHQIAALMTSSERMQRHRAIGDYYRRKMDQSGRKVELLPMINQQYRLCQYEQGVFETNCKLLSHYHRLDMSSQAERLFIEIEASPRFSSLPAVKKLRIYCYGCAAMSCTLNISVLNRVWMDAVKIDGNISMFWIVNVYRFIREMIKNGKLWTNDDHLNKSLTALSKDAQKELLFKSRILGLIGNIVSADSGAVDFRYLLGLLTNLNMLVRYSMQIPLEQRIEMVLENAVISFGIGNIPAYKSIVKYLGLLNPDKKQDQVYVLLEKFQTYSRHEIERTLFFPFFCTTLHSCIFGSTYRFNQVVLYGQMITSIILRLSWHPVEPNNMGGFGDCLVFTGEGGKIILPYLRRMRIWLSANPTSSVSPFNFATSTMCCSYLLFEKISLEEEKNDIQNVEDIQFLAKSCFNSLKSALGCLSRTYIFVSMSFLYFRRGKLEKVIECIEQSKIYLRKIAKQAQRIVLSLHMFYYLRIVTIVFFHHKEKYDSALRERLKKCFLHLCKSGIRVFISDPNLQLSPLYLAGLHIMQAIEAALLGNDKVALEKFALFRKISEESGNKHAIALTREMSFVLTKESTPEKQAFYKEALLFYEEAQYHTSYSILKSLSRT